MSRKLFDLLSREHGLPLLESELDDIKRVVREEDANRRIVSGLNADASQLATMDAAPQTPEAATPTPRTDQNINSKSEYGDWGAPTQFHYVYPEFARTLERELQAVTVKLENAESRLLAKNELIQEMHETKSAELELLRSIHEPAIKLIDGLDVAGCIISLREELATLRTALATAEARISELSTKVAMAGKLQGLTEDNLAKAHERNDSLTRQLTEAQAACEVRGEALNQAATVFEIYAKLHSEKHTSEGDRKANENRLQAIKLRTALQPKVCTDLLKRLADVEKDKERLDKISTVGIKTRTTIEGSLVFLGGMCIANEPTLRQAIDAARTHPKP